MKDIKEFENRIICGDCLEIMGDLPDKSVDLCLTDPPYGISADKGTNGFGQSPSTVRNYNDNWDNARLSKAQMDVIFLKSHKAIFFGGNYFTDILPQNNHWIVWDKVGEMKVKNPFSHCELLWTNVSLKTVKKYIVIQQGFISEEKVRFHPTQKPVSLIENILKDYSKEGDCILDPFIGSGTTAIACKRLNRRYIGIEINPDYCKIAEKRLANIPPRFDSFDEKSHTEPQATGKGHGDGNDAKR